MLSPFLLPTLQHLAATLRAKSPQEAMPAFPAFDARLIFSFHGFVHITCYSRKKRKNHDQRAAPFIKIHPQSMSPAWTAIGRTGGIKRWCIDRNRDALRALMDGWVVRHHGGRETRSVRQRQACGRGQRHRDRRRISRLCSEKPMRDEATDTSSGLRANRSHSASNSHPQTRF